jgi:hypothetical protein
MRRGPGWKNLESQAKSQSKKFQLMDKKMRSKLRKKFEAENFKQ